MTNEEIDALVARLERTNAPSLKAVSAGLWLAGAVVTPLTFVQGFNLYAGILAAVLGFVGFALRHEAKDELRSLSKRGAQIVWREWSNREILNERGVTFKATAKMRDEIEKIYQKNPRGESFPPKQAVRLVDTYNRQLQRLETVETHLEGLRETRGLLLEKTAQLRELGDQSRDVSATLSRVEADLPALETLSGEIRASCLRLEALLVSVKTAVQVKQLHQELDELASSVAPEAQIAVSESDDLLDIEAQITREIETFLRLERDTDAHLRQL